MIEADAKVVESLPGSPAPLDLFEPHMPGVDVLADMTALFEKARQFSAERHHIAIVTPSRMIMGLAGPTPGSMPDSALAAPKALLGEIPLQIAAISYTKPDALLEDKSMTKCIPFVGHLMSFVYCGHRVVVFEGHPSAFEAGVRGADVLLVDSGMIAFLQNDWREAAFRLMKPAGRLLVHDRVEYRLTEITPQTGGTPARNLVTDGHETYVKALLSTLASSMGSACLVNQAPLLDVASLTDDPRLLAWIASLAIEYESLVPTRIIDLLLRAARSEGLFRRRLVLRSTFVEEGGKPIALAFRLTSTLSAEGKQSLKIEPL